MKKRNALIDWVKLVYAIPILLVHSNHLVQGTYNWKNATIMPGGYLTVEFFFIVSGYFMAASVAKKVIPSRSVGVETIRYILHRISIILPYYLVAFAFGFICAHALTPFTAKSILKDLANSFFPFIRVNMSGLNAYDPIGTAWYLSAMFLATMVLYPMLCRYKDMFINIIAPLITLFLYGYIARSRGNISAAAVWIGWVYVGLLRAFAGMSLGCICYEAAEKLKQLHLTEQAKVALTVIEFTAYILPLFAMQFVPFSELDFVIIFVFAMAVTISLSMQSYSSKIICHAPLWVSQIGLTVFLCQDPLINFTNRLLPSWDLHQRFPVYMMISFLSGILCLWGGNVLKRWYGKHKGRICKAILTD